MIQHAPTKFTLNVVVRDAETARTELKEISSRLAQHFKSPLDIAMNIVPEIAKTRTGKQKFTICEIER